MLEHPGAINTTCDKKKSGVHGDYCCKTLMINMQYGERLRSINSVNLEKLNSRLGPDMLKIGLSALLVSGPITCLLSLEVVGYLSSRLVVLEEEL